MERARRALAADDLVGALAGLERDRWLAADRGGAALLFAGCLLARGRHADAIDTLRAYLAKTGRARSDADDIAIRLLRHHATGGGERARTAREACYFGLYALGALGEPETARADLERALREAPETERLLVRAAWKP
jgi:tetratricopeptide (TPR) repeat protein